MKFACIYADPPWPETGGGKIKRGADRHYPLMKVQEIVALPVADLAAENAHLYCWVTNNHLPAGLEVVKAWGFRFVTMITWTKPGRIGLGQWFRGQTEHCLFAVRGKLPYKVLDGKRQQGRTWINAERQAHSVKPKEMREMIERVSYPPFLELFARETVPGWYRWGREAPDGESCVELEQMK